MTENLTALRATIRNFRMVQTEGSHSVTRTVDHDSIVTVGDGHKTKASWKLIRRWDKT
jgi:hypothetical protein